MAAFDPARETVRRVLCFGAHPDDLDFGASGTVAAWTRAGVEVQYCIMTDGDAGGFDPAHRGDIVAMRHEEQRGAARSVGVEQVHFLGERDGYLEPTHEVQRKIVALIRRVGPDVVLAMHPERDWTRMQRSHPDHLACGEAVTRAVYPAVENPYAYPDLQESGLEAFKLRWLWLYGGPEERQNHAVDITDTFDAKLTALRAHLSQHPDVAKMESFVRSNSESLAAAHGWGTGRLAEVFHVVEVNAADTIAGF
ncbi:PIG-L deacetylase family protein [Arthrobacter sp.]|uniref:PIG-L deacetylase family protein n=1 Tax=Arthrobacter sp. TaxID=1667 RepID=UPI003A92955B